jgi:hypothetical protein
LGHSVALVSFTTVTSKGLGLGISLVTPLANVNIGQMIEILAANVVAQVLNVLEVVGHGADGTRAALKIDGVDRRVVLRENNGLVKLGRHVAWY